MQLSLYLLVIFASIACGFKHSHCLFGNRLTANCNRINFRLRSSKNSDNKDDKQLTEIGSKDYYKGFFSSPLVEQPGTSADNRARTSSRGDGVEQAIKLGGGVAVVLTLLTIVFLASNGLIKL